MKTLSIFLVALFAFSCEPVVRSDVMAEIDAGPLVPSEEGLAFARAFEGLSVQSASLYLEREFEGLEPVTFVDFGTAEEECSEGSERGPLLRIILSRTLSLGDNTGVIALISENCEVLSSHVIDVLIDEIVDEQIRGQFDATFSKPTEATAQACLVSRECAPGQLCLGEQCWETEPVLFEGSFSATRCEQPEVCSFALEED